MDWPGVFFLLLHVYSVQISGIWHQLVESWFSENQEPDGSGPGVVSLGITFFIKMNE